MRICVLAKYPGLGASSRVRMYQYVPALRAAGFDITSHALLYETYLQDLYSGSPRRKLGLIRSYADRIRILLQRGNYDLLWIEKEALPWLPWLVEKRLLHGRPYVVDYDDAVFHNYDLHPSPYVRMMLGEKIDGVMRDSALVIAGNEYLATRARRAGAKRVEVLPSGVAAAHYPVTSYPEGEPFVVGWIGSPGSEVVLDEIMPVLEILEQTPGVILRFVGASGRNLSHLNVDIRPWIAAREAEELSSFNVGIMPLQDQPFQRGKCAFKLVQYMAAGRPVIASPVGANTEVVTDGWNGYLPRSMGEWIQAIHTLRAEPDAARTMGERGRRRFLEHYSVETLTPRLIELLGSIA